MTKLTPKQRVLKRFPRAHCYEWAGPTYCIYPGDVKIVRGKERPWILNNTLGLSERTPKQAWAGAAKELRV